MHGDTAPVAAEDQTTVCALLEERRANLTAQRVRLVNQLHALLRDLLPGGARTRLTAKAATALLRRLRPTSAAERTRKQIARDLICEIRAVDARLVQIAQRMTDALGAQQTQLLEVPGVGPVLAVRLIGRTGRAARFPSSAAFASYAGVAPIEAASGDRARHRLSRSGDRQLNCALHLVAVTQVRMRDSVGRRYYERKIAEGKTHNEAMRCLKRRIADRVWRQMLRDEQRPAEQSTTFVVTA
jgi:transposase